MKFLLFVIYCLLFFHAINAQLPEYSWAKSWGSNGFEAEPHIETDNFGNIYVTGEFTREIDFDPSEGTSILIPIQGANSYISKFDSSGHFLWVKHLKGPSTSDIIFDSEGYIYLCGTATGNTDFDPGPDTFNIFSSYGCAFVLKLDLEGNFIWAVTTEGGSATGNSLTLDHFGNVILVGEIKDLVDFDPGPGQLIFNVLGIHDGFVAKYGSDGKFIWAKQFAGDHYGYAISVDIDISSNIYIIGLFDDSRDFDPGPDSAFIEGDLDFSFNTYVVKLDNSGNFNWVRHLDSKTQNVGNSIAVDGSGNSHITGEFEGPLDFDPGPDSLILMSHDFDVFILKLDKNGELVWVKQFVGKEYDSGMSISLDSYGGVYTTGHFSDTCDFDPGPGNNILIPVGENGKRDIFISKLNKNGEFVWAYSMGGNDQDFGTDIKTDGLRNLIFGGHFRDSTHFSPVSENGDILVSNGSADIYLAKWKLCPNITVSQQGELLIAHGDHEIVYWLDCDNGYNVVGTGYEFSPSENGSYAVAGESSQCVDTSECYVYVMTNSEYIKQENHFSIYPNPLKEFFYLDLGTQEAKAAISITNISGNILYRKDFYNEQLISIHLKKPPGLYFLFLRTEQQQSVFKLLLK